MSSTFPTPTPKALKRKSTKRRATVSPKALITTAIMPVEAPAAEDGQSSSRIFTLVNNQKRSVLSEGRSHGFGFALCAYDSETSTLTTVQPFSPCKDYLNDVCYSEWTKKDYSACGLKTKYHGIFQNGRAWLAFRICGQGCQSTIEKPNKYNNMDKDLQAIEENMGNALKLINEIDTLLKVPQKTRLYKVTTNCVVAKLDIYWVKWSYRVSLISLLLRNAFYYDGATPVMDWLKKQSQQGQDAYMIKSAITHMERAIKEGVFPDDDWERTSTMYNDKPYPVSWHGAGICNWIWPEDRKKQEEDAKLAREKALEAKAAAIKATPAPLAVPPIGA